ncbi:MAG: hypothetical protein ABSA70_00050 [Terriglobia bacterium]
MARFLRAVCALLSGFTLISCLPTESLKVEFPQHLKVPRIVVGQDTFKKSVFFEQASLGPITDIRYSQFTNRREPALVIVGGLGATFLGEDRQATRTVHFQRQLSERVALVHVKADTAPWFLGQSMRSVVLYDQTGAVRWTYSSFWGIDDAAAGDVNGDGVAEVAVGLNGFGGLRLLNADGHQLWGRYGDGNIWHVEILPADGANPARIFHTEAGGELKVRDARGEVIARHRPDFYVSHFSLTRWGDELQAGHFVSVGDGYILVYDLNGQQTQRLDAPGCDRLGDAVGTPVRFAAGGTHYATLVDYSLWNRALLLVHDPTGRLIYEEVLPERCAALGTISAGDGEELLAGCTGTVWEYSVVSAAQRGKAGRGKRR